MEQEAHTAPHGSRLFGFGGRQHVGVRLLPCGIAELGKRAPSTVLLSVHESVKWTETIEFCRTDHTVDRRGTSPARIRSGKQVVFRAGATLWKVQIVKLSSALGVAPISSFCLFGRAVDYVRSLALLTVPKGEAWEVIFAPAPEAQRWLPTFAGAHAEQTTQSSEQRAGTAPEYVEPSGQ